MIKQKTIVIKTADATLTVAEMGDIIVNKATAVTITLPSPSTGLWFRISNVNTGLVTVKYGSTSMTTLKQTEQCLCLSNITAAWFFSKGGGVMTKAEIEDILTGEITSHSHPLITKAALESILTGLITSHYHPVEHWETLMYAGNPVLTDSGDNITAEVMIYG